MKSLFKFLIIVLFVFVTTGCGKNKSYLLKTCTKNYNGDMLGLSYEMKSEYKIYAKGEYVNKIEITETVSSDSDVIIANYYDLFLKNYESYNDIYGGITNKLSSNITEIKSETEMNFDKINIKKYVEDNSYLENYLVDNKIKAEGVVEYYQGNGAICN